MFFLQINKALVVPIHEPHIVREAIHSASGAGGVHGFSLDETPDIELGVAPLVDTADERKPLGVALVSRHFEGISSGLVVATHNTLKNWRQQRWSRAIDG